MAGMVSIPNLATAFDTAELQAALEGILLDTAVDMVDEYEGIVADWQHPVIFDVELEAEGEFTIVVGTDDQIFQWTSEGTKPHPIAAVNAPSLVFPSLWSPKTAKNSLGAQPGGIGKHLGHWRKEQVVQHPGTEAREFDEDIGLKYQDILTDKLRDFLLRWEG